MAKHKDITGQRFGSLFAICRVGTKFNAALWLCQCDCGDSTAVMAHVLRAGDRDCCQQCISRRRQGSHSIDISGRRFGRLVAQKRIGRHKSYSLWTCVCDCGNHKNASYNVLAAGGTRSCGCARKKHGDVSGNKWATEYRSWSGMIQRCTNPSNAAYSDYGGRGVSVCDQWLNSYESFLADMGRKPFPWLSLDRVDTNGNYEPGNCRWATKGEQARNRRPHRPYKRSSRPAPPPTGSTPVLVEKSP